MAFHVVNRDVGTTVNLNDLTLGSYNLGSYEGVGWSTWNATGFDFSQGFTVTGTIALGGTFGSSQERSKLELQFGKSTD
jgi:hypothetical protein